MAPDDGVVNPLGLDITDEDRANAAAMRHVPDRDEIRALLVKYSEAPITEEVVDRVERRFKEARSTRGTSMSYRRHFESPTQWRGKAWNEEFSGNRRSMTPRDLVLLLAQMISDHDSSFPQPKLYCPEAFAGTWAQVEPKPTIDEPCLWHLAADSTFRTNSPDVPSNKRYWSVELDHGTPVESWFCSTSAGPWAGPGASSVSPQPRPSSPAYTSGTTRRFRSGCVAQRRTKERRDARRERHPESPARSPRRGLDITLEALLRQLGQKIENHELIHGEVVEPRRCIWFATTAS